ncbi:MAG: anaerobic ribonucleoside-triphosphate reductase activating protein [Bacteroidales bacterium]|jgi:anaerobic ribonucleoside-triphosphate reductase activating protein|nr:anaerobic ribonucleoside-triphosphate reductase activating protein [Bacteroidales bacterium]
MLRYASFDIVFQEIPGEITLALNLSGCPNRCHGCHSPHLQQNTGEELTETSLSNLLNVYKNAVTCICFMGGDGSPEEVLKLAKVVRQFHKKVAWYSGSCHLYENAHHCFDYIKLGKYIEKLGGLNSPTTNQRFYRIENKTLIDMTSNFRTQNRV